MKRKKIAIVTTGLLPVPAIKGGAVENLIELMLEENEKEHKIDFEIFSCFNEEAFLIAKQKYPHSKFHFIKTNSVTYKMLDWFIIKVNHFHEFGRLFGLICSLKIKKHSFDAVLVENFPFHIRILKRFLDIPIFFHAHNSYISDSHKRADIWLKNLDGVISVSEFIKKEIENFKQKTNSDCPIVVAHNGIKLNNFSKKIEKSNIINIKQSLEIPLDHKVIIFAGRFIPAKGVKQLIEAFKKLPERERCTLLVIGGKSFSSQQQTPYIQEVKELAKDINVVFTGYIDYSKIYKYYSLGEILVIPSLWEEPACLVSLEAMSSGIPVVASDSGGNFEHLGDAGFEVKRGDNFVEDLSSSMHNLLNNESLRQEMSKKGKMRVLKFSSKNYYDSMIMAINTLFDAQDS